MAKEKYRKFISFDKIRVNVLKNRLEYNTYYNVSHFNVIVHIDIILHSNNRHGRIAPKQHFSLYGQYTNCGCIQICLPTSIVVRSNSINLNDLNTKMFEN